MPKQRKARKSPGFFAALWLVSVLVPSLSLMALGSYWLWQQGWLIAWALGALAVTLAIFGWQLYLFKIPIWRRGGRRLVHNKPAGTAADPVWNPAEQRAWAEVEAIADKIDPAKLQSRDAFLALGLRTVEAVAESLHPDVDQPVYRFTVPEALTLIERVVHRLRPAIRDYLPFADQITVGQMLRLYEWRSVAGYVGKVFEIWRVIRLVNPLTALAHEAREQLSKQAMEWGRQAIVTKLTRIFVEEVGRAAIDLYGGRLAVEQAALSSYLSPDSRADLQQIEQRAREPIRIVLAAQADAQKPALLAALLADPALALTAIDRIGDRPEGRMVYEWRPLPLPEGPSSEALPTDSARPETALLIDMPGFAATEAAADDALTGRAQALLDELTRADMVIWVTSAVRADRAGLRHVRQALTAWFAAHEHLRPPAMFCIMTDSERLPPVAEWQPPYELSEDAGTPTASQLPEPAAQKRHSIIAARAAIAEDLGVPPEDVVPVSLENPAVPYGLDDVLRRFGQKLHEARAAHLARSLRGAAPKTSVKRVWGQVLKSGRALLGRTPAKHERDEDNK